MGVFTSCADIMNSVEVCFSLAVSFPHKLGQRCEIFHSSQKMQNSERDWLTASSHVQRCSYKCCTNTRVGTNDGGSIRGACTSLDGLRRTSPTPPPLLKPWLRTVTMHISRESHVRSTSSSSSPSLSDGYTATLLALLSPSSRDNSEVKRNSPWCFLPAWLARFIFSVNPVNFEELLNQQSKLTEQNQKQDVYDFTVFVTPINSRLNLWRHLESLSMVDRSVGRSVSNWEDWDIFSWCLH